MTWRFRAFATPKHLLCHVQRCVTLWADTPPVLLSVIVSVILT